MSSLNQLKGKLCFPSENYVLLLKGDEVSVGFVDSLPVGELCSHFRKETSSPRRTMFSVLKTIYGGYRVPLQSGQLLSSRFSFTHLIRHPE